MQIFFLHIIMSGNYMKAAMSQYIMLRHGCFCKDAYSVEKDKGTIGPLLS